MYNGFLIIVCVIVGFLLYSNYKKINNIAHLSQKYTPEFEEVYNKLYNENFSTLEGKRHSIKFRALLIVLSLIIMLVGMLFFNVLIALLGFASAFILIATNKKEKEYNLEYKRNIISKFIKTVNNNLEYAPKVSDLNTLRSEYIKANFSNEAFDIFYADDFIQGNLIPNYFTQMSDLNIQQKEVHYNDGKRVESTKEIFKGIFVKTSCDKNINTYIKISRNQLKLFRKSNRVEMDSQEFEKYFDIYSGDKLLTMRILTSDVMQTLIDFCKNYKIDYEIIIRNNNIYMRFFTGAMFEPRIFGSSMDKKLLFSYFCMFKFIVDVTNEINKALKEIEL